EGRCRARVAGGVETPRGRPRTREQLAEFVAVLREAGPAPLAVEVVLVPEAVLALGRLRLQRAGDVLDVVAAGRDEPTHALRPQGGHHARRAAAPVVTGQHGLAYLEGVEQRAQVLAQHRL